MGDTEAVVGLPSVQFGSDMEVNYDSGPNGGFHFGGEYDLGFRVALDHYIGPSVDFSAGLTGPEMHVRANAKFGYWSTRSGNDSENGRKKFKMPNVSLVGGVHFVMGAQEGLSTGTKLPVAGIEFGPASDSKKSNGVGTVRFLFDSQSFTCQVDINLLSPTF